MTSWFELRISIQTIAESFPFFSSDSLVPTETKFKHRVKRTSADDIFFLSKECEPEDYCNYCDLQEGYIIIFIVLIQLTSAQLT